MADGYGARRSTTAADDDGDDEEDEDEDVDEDYATATSRLARTVFIRTT